MFRNDAAKLLMLLGMLTVLSACKIIVINPEGTPDGGQVTVGSTNQFCQLVGDEVCTVTVDNTNFGIQLVAQPDANYQFVGWHDGDGFLCAGQPATCDYDLSPLAGIPFVEALVASSSTFYAMPIFAPINQTFTADGKEWYRPDLFADVSYNDVLGLCGPSFVCPQGSFLNGVNVSGFKLADANEVLSLFDSLGVPTFQIIGGLGYVEVDSSWAPLIQAIFGITESPNITTGITSSLGLATVLGTVRDEGPGQQDFVNVFESGMPASQSSNLIGAWFYRL